jgi:16S rRNA (guanine(966)-N(2))-methyltransferase RsmD
VKDLKKIRPTSGRVKAALFSVLASAGLADADFLDLFAGTGAVAAGALARGARGALCVESDRAASKSINAMFANAGYDAAIARCVHSDVRRALPKLAGGADGRRFGVIFADPPYNMGWGEELPRLIAENKKLLAPGGVFAFERSSRERVSNNLDIFLSRDDKIYGETVISFFWSMEEDMF